MIDCSACVVAAVAVGDGFGVAVAAVRLLVIAVDYLTLEILCSCGGTWTCRCPVRESRNGGLYKRSLARAKIRYFLYSMYILRKDTIIALFSISVAL